MLDEINVQPQPQPSQARKRTPSCSTLVLLGVAAFYCKTIVKNSDWREGGASPTKTSASGACPPQWLPVFLSVIESPMPPPPDTPLPPPTPPPPGTLVPPPSAPTSYPPPLHPACDSSDTSAICSVTLAIADYKCAGMETLACLKITPHPFVLAQIAGQCLDQNHQVVASGCLTMNEPLLAFAEIYPGPDGLILSANKQFSPALGMNGMDALDAETYCLSVNAGYVFQLDSNATSKIYRSNTGLYCSDCHHCLDLCSRRAGGLRVHEEVVQPQDDGFGPTLAHDNCDRKTGGCQLPHHLGP